MLSARRDTPRFHKCTSTHGTDGTDKTFVFCQACLKLRMFIIPVYNKFAKKS